MSGYKSPSSKFQQAVSSDDVNGQVTPEGARAEQEGRHHPSKSTSKALVYHRDVPVSCVSQHGQSQTLGCCEMAPTCICPAVSDMECFAFCAFVLYPMVQGVRTVGYGHPSSIILGNNALAPAHREHTLTT
jgi:hypothetical protein